tara:strand:- start:521 stop:745 length:225 start_codon:yes stop_codon:yes gene_type:complete
LLDLIITDLLMQEKDGVEVLLDLRANHPEMKAIVISGKGQEFLLAAKNFSALHTFSKPLDAKEVIATVRRILND